MTSEPKWTPGPWDFSMAKMPVDGEYDYCISAMMDGERHVISEAFGRVSEKQRPNAHANARLIAAAPELYEALETAAEALENYSDVLDGMDGHPRPNDAMKALMEVNAALKKARGE